MTVLLAVPLLLAVSAAGCRGRVPVGHFLPGADVMPFETAEEEGQPDALPDDPGSLPDFVADWTGPEWWDMQPDVPPLPCEVDADCPPTGLEPCYRSKCSLDVETGLKTCGFAQDQVCGDPGQCLLGKCVPGAGCIEVKVSNGEPCDDGDLCSVGDSCKAGVCMGQQPDCDDGNACTADMCDGESGLCYHLSVPTPCSDGNVCTEGDKCSAGVCTPGVPVSCDDADVCTADMCDPVAGCVHNFLQECCNFDSDCADLDECTVDTCVLPQHSCKHSDAVCKDNSPCTFDKCDVDSGCVFVPIPGCCQSDSDCQDDDACTVGKCVGATCQYVQAVECKDTNPCTADTCDPAVGCVFLPIAECCLTNSDCNDKDSCTEDWCAANKCQHKPAVCADSNPCTADKCDPLKGCQFVPIQGCCLEAKDCDDANVCTLDWCTGNKCQHDTVKCDDGNICTKDSCDAVKGCTHTKIAGCCLADSDCWDGNVCVKAYCENSKCGKIPVSCDDGNICTKDSCDAVKGCTYQPVSGCCTQAAQCNDGDPCTNDTCVANVCQHKPKTTPDCCAPSCAGKQCGPDGCGAYCGNCPEDAFCDADGKCQTVCMPNCTGKQCGPDGCGTSCGVCDKPMVCSDVGKCVQCTPKCVGKQCGDDGCGGACGFCPAGQSCDTVAGVCKTGCTCVGAACWQDGFESGQLAGWTLDGDAEVIHNMGATDASQGWYMAFVGSGLSELELGKVQKTFCPPASAKFIGFKWKHYSEEFVEWCGTIYQDKFHVVVANGTQQIELLNLPIDDLCPPDSCPGCGKKYIGLELADVKFDQGDVWMTPWSTAFYELPAGFEGKPITLTFSVSDVGDLIYVTAILIDSIQFM